MSNPGNKIYERVPPTLEEENALLKAKLQELSEENFVLKATISTIEVEVKYNAEKEVKRLQSEISFMNKELAALNPQKKPNSRSTGSVMLSQDIKAESASMTSLTMPSQYPPVGSVSLTPRDQPTVAIPNITMPTPKYVFDNMIGSCIDDMSKFCEDSGSDLLFVSTYGFNFGKAAGTMDFITISLQFAVRFESILVHIINNKLMLTRGLQILANSVEISKFKIMGFVEYFDSNVCVDVVSTCSIIVKCIERIWGARCSVMESCMADIPEVCLIFAVLEKIVSIHMHISAAFYQTAKPITSLVCGLLFNNDISSSLVDPDSADVLRKRKLSSLADGMQSAGKVKLALFPTVLRSCCQHIEDNSECWMIAANKLCVIVCNLATVQDALILSSTSTSTKDTEKAEVDQNILTMLVNLMVFSSCKYNESCGSRDKQGNVKDGWIIMSCNVAELLCNLIRYKAPEVVAWFDKISRIKNDKSTAIPVNVSNIFRSKYDNPQPIRLFLKLMDHTLDAINSKMQRSGHFKLLSHSIKFFALFIALGKVATDVLHKAEVTSLILTLCARLKLSDRYRSDLKLFEDMEAMLSK